MPATASLAAASAIVIAMTLAFAALPATAQDDANAEDQTEAGVKTTEPKLEPFTPEPNSSAAADELLAAARTEAAAGNFAQATQSYLTLLRHHLGRVTQAGDRLFLPVWKLAADDLRTWPAEGRKTFAAEIQAEADPALASAKRSGNLVELEQVAQKFLATEAGPTAAMILGDRLREEGRAALALYYYTLALEHAAAEHVVPAGSAPGDSALPRDLCPALLLRAAVAAREAGLERRFEAILDQLKKLPTAPALPGETPAPPAAAPASFVDWLARRTALPPLRDLTGGFGNLSANPPVQPTAIMWQVNLGTQDETPPARAAFYRSNNSRNQPPTLFPTVAADLACVAAGDRVWAIEPLTGRVRWRYENRRPPTPAEEVLEPLQPQFWHGQMAAGSGRQALVTESAVYVPLDQPPSEDQAARRRANPFAGQQPSAAELVALDRAGRLLWRWRPELAVAELADLNPVGQPVAAGSAVVVALESSSAFFGELHIGAVDRQSGRTLWVRPVAAFANYIKGSPPYGSGSLGLLGGALAERGGLIFSSVVGLTSAQSAVSGQILWSRLLPELRPVPQATVATDGSSEIAVVGGVAPARLSRLLADRGLVLSGSPLAPRIEAVDWLTGQLAWSQPHQGACYPLALDGRLAFTWGAALAAFDFESGAPAAWSPVKMHPLPAPVKSRGPKSPRPDSAENEQPLLLIVAEPVVAAGQVFVPTRQGLTVLSAADGQVAAQHRWPAAGNFGNLALTRHGLLAVSDERIMNLLDWETGRARYLDLAQVDPRDTTGLAALAWAAARLGQIEEAAGFLEQALDREPAGGRRLELSQVYADLYRGTRGRVSAALAARILDRLRSSAGDPALFCEQALLRAEFYADRDPRLVVAALQELLDRPDCRDLALASPVGRGLAGLVAEQTIERLLARHGREIYDPWEELAQAARAAAAAKMDYDGLLATALRYPNSLAARRALDDALALALGREELTEAGRLLARLVNVTPEGRRRTEYQALLTDSRRLLAARQKQPELLAGARLQAAVLRQAPPETEVRLVNGERRTAGELLAELPAQASDFRWGQDQPRPALPPPPYRRLWQIEAKESGGPLSAANIYDLRPAGAVTSTPPGAGDEPLFLAGGARLLALNRPDGRILWSFKFDSAAARDGPMQVLRTGQGLFVCGRGRVASLEPRTGLVRWQTRLQPQPVLRPLPTVASVGGGLRYGDQGWSGGSNLAPAALGEVGDILIINTKYSVYLIDEQDGYAIRTSGYPGGVRGGRFSCYGAIALGLPEAPPPMTGLAMVWDLAAGRLVRQWRIEPQAGASDVITPGGATGPLRPIVGFNYAGPSRSYVADLEKLRLWRIPLEVRLYHNRVTFSDGVFYCLTDEGRQVEAVEAESGRSLWSWKPAAGQRITGLEEIGAGRLAATGEGRLTVLAARDGRVVFEKEYGPKVYLHGLSAGGDHLRVMLNAEAGARNFAVFYELPTGREIFAMDLGDRESRRTVTTLGPALLLTSPTQTEYWISDPDGDLRSAELQLPAKPPADESGDDQPDASQ